MKITVPGFISRLKKRIPNWKDDIIYISKKDTYKVIITIIIEGKLKHLESYIGEYEIDFFVPKLIEYFDWRTYDDNEYYVKYSDKRNDYSRVFLVKNKDTSKVLELVRKTEGDKGCGIKSIPKNSFDENKLVLL